DYVALESRPDSSKRSSTKPVLPRRALSAALSCSPFSRVPTGCAGNENAAATNEIGNADDASEPRIYRNLRSKYKLSLLPLPSALHNALMAGAGVVSGITIMQRYCCSERSDVDPGGASWQSADGALAKRGRDLRIRQFQQTTHPTDC